MELEFCLFRTEVLRAAIPIFEYFIYVYPDIDNIVKGMPYKSSLYKQSKTKFAPTNVDVTVTLITSFFGESFIYLIQFNGRNIAYELDYLGVLRL